MLNLNKLEQNLDYALRIETKYTLTKWLNGKRKTIKTCECGCKNAPNFTYCCECGEYLK